MNSRQRDLAQRRRRQSGPAPSKQAVLLNQLAADVNVTNSKIQVWLNETEGSVKKVTENIAQGLALIAKAGTKNGTVIAQWNSMRSELRKGIQLIIDAYNKYLGLHEKLLVDIRRYVQGLIKKYTAEQLAVDQMVPPVSIDPDQQLPESWQKLLQNYLAYALRSGNALTTSFDASSDSSQNLMRYYTNLFAPPRPSTVQVIPLNPIFYNANQYQYEQEPISCDDIDQDNGNRPCADSLATASVKWASQACGCQTYE